MSNTSTSSVRATKKLIPELRFPEFVEDGEWEEKKLGNIGDPLMCKRIFKDQTTPNPENGIPFYKIGTFGNEADSFIPVDLYNEFKLKYNFPNKGDILISASGTIGRLVIYNGASAYFQDSNIVWLGHDETEVTNKFLFYCYSIVNWQTSDGGVIKRLYNSDLKNISIAYPGNEIEQQKIASCLASLDELITAHNDKLDALKDHKKGLMQNLFPQEGATVPKYRFPEFEKDGVWVKTRLDQHIEIVSGFAFKSKFFSEKGRKLVTPKNFTKEGKASFDDRNTKYTTEEFNSKYLCVTDDLLLLLTDLTPSCELLGKPILLKQEDGEALLNQRIIKVEIKSSLNKRFLLQFFLTNQFHRRVKSTASGTTVRHSSNKIIFGTNLLIPDNPEEQQKIAFCLSAVDEIITAMSEKIVQLQQHKKGLIQGLFPKNNR